MENALPTLIIGALLLIASAVLTHANVQSHDQLSQSFRDMEERLGHRVQSELDVVNTSLDDGKDTLSLSLFNGGQTRISAYPRMDVIVIYESASGHMTKWVPFADQSLVMDSWEVSSIQDDGFEPGLLNPGETAQITVKLPEPVLAGQTNRIVIVSDAGLVVSAPFSS
jgi:archaellum component FlaG (FlaF/FlaG flagellin family)